MQDNNACSLLIKQIHDNIEKQSNNTLRSMDLTMMQVAVLLELNGSAEKKLSLKELEKRFQVAQSTIHGIISRLEQKGLIQAEGAADDKRIKIAAITGTGSECCTDAAREMQKTEDMLLKGFSNAEKAIFREMLLRAAENIK